MIVTLRDGNDQPLLVPLFVDVVLGGSSLRKDQIQSDNPRAFCLFVSR